MSSTHREIWCMEWVKDFEDSLHLEHPWGLEACRLLDSTWQVSHRRPVTSSLQSHWPVLASHVVFRLPRGSQSHASHLHMGQGSNRGQQGIANIRTLQCVPCIVWLLILWHINISYHNLDCFNPLAVPRDNFAEFFPRAPRFRDFFQILRNFWCYFRKNLA